VRIFVAGATGAIGRALLPLLAAHEVVGMTRSRPDLVRDLGARPVVCDVYDRERLLAVVAGARPTDLAVWDFGANNRIRREGTRNLVDAAVAAGARRLVVESVDFELPPDGEAAVREMERIARESGLQVDILRFGRLWGPHTGHEENPGEPGRVHVSAAARAVVDTLGRSSG
jgi:nucleoside-diphosphate-sugar epimerase